MIMHCIVLLALSFTGKSNRSIPACPPNFSKQTTGLDDSRFCYSPVKIRQQRHQEAGRSCQGGGGDLIPLHKMNPKSYCVCHLPGGKGFSLVELLAVIAIIGILGALLIPLVGSIQTRARQSQSEALFTQLATACLNYRTDYGYFPLFGRPAGSGDTAVRLQEAAGDVYRTLTAYDPLTGQSILQTAKRDLNRRGRSYYSFAESDLDGEYVVDAFGNRDIVVLLDTDDNGQLGQAMINSLEPATHIDGRAEDAFKPVFTRNLRQRVAIYSAGGGAGRAVHTWQIRDE